MEKSTGASAMSMKCWKQENNRESYLQSVGAYTDAVTHVL